MPHPTPTLAERYNTALLITGGYWIFGDPDSDVGGVATVGRGLASPLLGAESGWRYWAGGVWQTDDEFLSVKGIIMMTHN